MMQDRHAAIRIILWVELELSFSIKPIKYLVWIIFGAIKKPYGMIF
jgi:hypothetical protein